MIENHQPLDACSIQERYLAIKQRVWRAAEACGRDTASIKLIAVSKMFGEHDIRPVLDEGHCDFGENRVQEAIKKWSSLHDETDDICLHLIGPLQTNKVREAVNCFDVIHTLDRIKLAEALAQAFEREQKTCALLVQVNVGNEAQKAGVAVDEAEALINECRTRLGLTITGLMCIPPVDEDPVPYFKTMQTMRDRFELAELSMGMSDDFEKAITYGATMVRVGSAIFGSR